MPKSKEPPATRVYLISNRETGEPVALIDAANLAQAERFFFAKRFSGEYASQRDLFRAASKEIQIEVAGEESEESAKTRESFRS